jgi:hypothetical protein
MKYPGPREDHAQETIGPQPIASNSPGNGMPRYPSTCKLCYKLYSKLYSQSLDRATVLRSFDGMGQGRIYRGYMQPTHGNSNYVRTLERR